LACSSQQLPAPHLHRELPDDARGGFPALDPVPSFFDEVGKLFDDRQGEACGCEHQQVEYTIRR
jgi:hypothetical protein